MQKTNVYILLDKSGSMTYHSSSICRAINAFVRKLSHLPGRCRISFDAFSGRHVFDYEEIRSDAIPSRWRPASSEEIDWGGRTPLYDSIGTLVNKAENDEPAKAVLVIATDGEENASVSVTREEAEELLDACRARGWQVVFLAADFDGHQQAHDLGITDDLLLNTTGSNFAKAMSVLADHTSSYAASGEDGEDIKRISFSPQDKRDAT